jgi:ABC-type transport system involved in multi-copper enzyme maturation permease subunit
LFGTLFQKEVREHMMTFRFGAALITTFVLVIVSIWMLGGDYQHRLNLYNTLSENYKQELAGIWVPSQAVPKISYPPSPLSVFAQGDQRRFGNFAEIKRWEVPRKAKEGLTNNELLESVQPFDLLTIFTFVISLFGVLFSYDSISGERERGTLKMICTGNARRGSVFAAKFLALTTVLAIPFSISLLSGLIILQFILNIGLGAEQWLAIALMVVAGLIYGAIFVAAGMFFSALVRRSSTALIAALLVWVFGVFLIPAAGARLAESIIPIDPSTEIKNFEDESSKETIAKCLEYNRKSYPGSFETTVWGSLDYLAGGPVTIVYDGNPNAFLWCSLIIRHSEPLWQRRAEEIWNIVKQQEARKAGQAELSAALSSASPAFNLSAIFTRLAGTDYRQHERFLESARRYRRTFLNNFERKGYFGENAIKFFSRRDPEEISEEQYQARKSEYRRLNEAGTDWFDMSSTRNWDALERLPEDLIPPYVYTGDYTDPSSILQPLLILFVMVAIAFSAGVAVFVRYDVR